MLYYNRIDISEEIGPTKNNDSNECMAFHYLFCNHGIKFQDYVCNGCHDLMMLRLNISDTAIITVKRVDYHCITHDINKFEAIHLLENYELDDCGIYRNAYPRNQY